jgi:oxygen-independent coproporphyrinogen-3 oxidase
MRAQSPLSVYIHIPFCRVHCPYCDFYTYPSDRGRSEDFVQAVTNEVTLIPNRLAPEQFEVSTVYLGGGTPSILSPEHITRILTALKSVLTFGENPEITLEANPEDVSPARIQEWLVAGINRFSLGVQSSMPEMLQFLGRVHTADDVERALDAMSSLPNWSVDLMFGWKGHSRVQWDRELDKVLQFRPTHVSLYQLTLEKQTRFGVLAEQGKVSLTDHDTQADLYQAAVDRLAANAIVQYEVSNFARVGCESRHNQAYWNRSPYLGLGPAAASFLWARRTLNVKSLPRYVRLLHSLCSAVSSVEVLTPEVEQRERIWLLLRTSYGVPDAWFAPESEVLINRMLEEGFLETRHEDRISLTSKGMAIADEITRRLLLTDPR